MLQKLSYCWTLFRVLLYEFLIIEWGFPRQDGGKSTGIGQAKKIDLDGERVLCCHQDKPKVAVMVPYMGNLDLRRVCSE